jgi:endonuclease YncB( thermonuclease family)
MIRRDSFLDFLTWGVVGALLAFLVYVYATSSAVPIADVDSSEHLFDDYRVSRVVDGDSLYVQKDDVTLEIRLAGIDCPEFDQPFAKDAKQRVEQLCLGKLVTIKRLDTDRYGRIVCNVLVGELDLAEELLRSGLAWHFKKYDSSNHLAKLEEVARRGRLGIWADPHAVPPWEQRASRQAVDSD